MTLVRLALLGMLGLALADAAWVEAFVYAFWLAALFYVRTDPA